MENKEKRTQEKIRYLISLQNMIPRQLKMRYQKFLSHIMSQRADIKKSFRFIDGEIDKYSVATNVIQGISSNEIIKFWKRVRDVIIEIWHINNDKD